LAGIAALERKYPSLFGVELLSYLNIGNSKYERYGLVNPLPGWKTADETVKQIWVGMLRNLS